MSWWAWAEGVSNGLHVPPAEAEPDTTDTRSDTGPEVDDTRSADLVHRDLAQYWRDRRSL